jgi:hypothetical protein
MNLTLPPILFVSCLLFAYIIFDTWGDELGWRSAILPTVLMAVIPFIMLISQVVAINYRVYRAKRSNSVYGLGRAATIGAGLSGSDMTGGYFGKEEGSDKKEADDGMDSKEKITEDQQEEEVTSGEREKNKRKKRRTTRILQSGSILSPMEPSTMEIAKTTNQQVDYEDGDVSMITIVENPMLSSSSTSSAGVGTLETVTHGNNSSDTK